MPRYIDANIAENMLLDGYEISDVPTADVQEVIRCKDCKYFAYCDDCTPDEYECGFCYSVDACTEPNGYCYRAERRIDYEN